jgi:GT2 family glycosyltransferase
LKLKVAILIVSWNGKRDLEICLSSLDHIHNCQDFTIDIIVVDNHSTDNTPQFILENYKKIKLFVLEENLGFAGGNNVGLEYIIQENYDYVYLLNQDTLVTPDFLSSSLEIAIKDAEIAQLQSLLLQYKSPNLINSSGNPVHFLGFGYCGDSDKDIKDVNLSNVREIASASCAAVLIKVSALKQVGLFDPLFISYNEDVDLSWRIKLAGLKVALNPHSIVFHNYEFHKNPNKFYLLEKNRQIILIKNYRWRTLILFLPILFVFEIYMLFYAMLNGWGRKKLVSYTSLVRQLNIIFKQRKLIQVSRKVSDKEILFLFTPILEFNQTPNLIIKWGNAMVELYFKLIIKGIFW